MRNMQDKYYDKTIELAQWRQFNYAVADTKRKLFNETTVEEDQERERESKREVTNNGRKVMAKNYERTKQLENQIKRALHFFVFFLLLFCHYFWIILWYASRPYYRISVTNT